jgi:uncharacterized protein
MKVLFDTNVYVAEALLGRGAERMIKATADANWRIFATLHILKELEKVLTEQLRFPRRVARLSQKRIQQRSTLVTVKSSKHTVVSDPKDNPILAAARACGAHYLVTNDRHLLDLDPYEGTRIVSMDEYLTILEDRGLN